MNLKSLRELASDFKFLFSDTQQLVFKANDDLVLLINARINFHKAEEAAKLEIERARIQREEEAKAIRMVEQERARIQAEEEAKAKAAQVKPVEPIVQTELSRLFANVSPSIAVNEMTATLKTIAKPCPPIAEIIALVADVFDVDRNQAINWLASYDFKVKQAA